MTHLDFTEQYEGIYEILNQYSIRSITFDGLNKTTANRIANLRPMPSHFAIFARPTELMDLFENVNEIFTIFGILFYVQGCIFFCSFSRCRLSSE